MQDSVGAVPSDPAQAGRAGDGLQAVCQASWLVGQQQR